MHKIAMALSTFVLVGCVGNPPRQGSMALHDLGDIGGPPLEHRFPLAGIEITATSWLDSTAQLYRLAYSDPLRRHAYTESRWVAPPAELVERLLVRRLFSDQVPVRQGCRFRLVLDEFEQRFDTPQNSRAILAVQARLTPLRSDALVARRLFRIDQPAPSADARGGVLAARHAGEALAAELLQWMGELERDASRPLAACSSG